MCLLHYDLSSERKTLSLQHDMLESLQNLRVLLWLPHRRKHVKSRFETTDLQEGKWCSPSFRVKIQPFSVSSSHLCKKSLVQTLSGS